MDAVIAMTVQEAASLFALVGSVAGATIAINKSIGGAIDRGAAANARSIDKLRTEVNDKLSLQYIATQDLGSELAQVRGEISEVKGSIDRLTASHEHHDQRLDDIDGRLQRVETSG